MSTKNITFDPDAGVPKSVNLTIHTGANFSANFNVGTIHNSPYNFQNWTGSSQMAKSVAIGSSAYPVATFNVGFTSAAGGRINISLGSTETRNLAEGRYVYDLLVSSGSTTYSLANGNILVIAGISSAP